MDPIVVPGVYRRPAVRSPDFARAPTDVVGFVGFAGPNRLHEATRLRDWRDYEQRFLVDAAGAAIEPVAGSKLASAVRAYFANGGATCWVVNVGDAVRMPDGTPAIDPWALVGLLLGTPLSTGPAGAGRDWGLELLLRKAEVSMVVLPDLYATWASVTEETLPSLPLAEAGTFHRCGDESRPPTTTLGAEIETFLLHDMADTTFAGSPLLAAQQLVVERVEREKWRVMAILSAPPGLSDALASRWRDLLGVSSASALYWPWVLTQTAPGAPTFREDPCGYVAGTYARVDRARGPHHAPANLPLIGVVGTETPIDDRVTGRVYPRGVNPIRRGREGLVAYGARTLAFVDSVERAAESEPLSFVPGRRTLTAIARSVDQIGQAAVFEPNNAFLRIQLAQAIVGYLLGVHRDGALAGTTPEQAFRVLCDAERNPIEAVERGELVCEVQVALAVPSEFISFRLGRREGVTEIEEEP